MWWKINYNIKEIQQSHFQLPIIEQLHERILSSDSSENILKVLT
jgi:hypothetical protein